MDTRTSIEHILGLPRGTILKQQVGALAAKVDALAAQLSTAGRLAADAQARRMEQSFGLAAGTLSRFKA